MPMSFNSIVWSAPCAPDLGPCVTAMPSFHFLRYHNFSNNRSGCLVLQDVANSSDAPATWENGTRRMRRFRCAYIQLPKQSDLGEDENCVATIGGMLTIRWHGTWHRRVDPVLRSGSLSLYAGFAYNGINRYGRKTDTLLQLRMSQPNHVLLHRMEFTPWGKITITGSARSGCIATCLVQHQI